MRPKDYLIKWLNVPSNSVVKWRVKPLKKSIVVSVHQRITLSPLISTATSDSLEQKLAKNNLRLLFNTGRLAANELYSQEFSVLLGGVYAFVFDNTFSKSSGKTLLFNQYIECDLEPASEAVDADRASMHTLSGLVRNNQDYDVLRQLNSLQTGSHEDLSVPRRPRSGSQASIQLNNVVTSKNGQYLSGFLLKRKRKKNSKSYSRRFFSLNFKYGILNYYLNDQLAVVRGNMYIKTVAVTAVKHSREIIVDSGLEIWRLRALNEVDWEIWVSALDVIRLRANYNGLAASTAPRSADIGENLVGNLNMIQSQVEHAKRTSFNLVTQLREAGASRDECEPKKSLFKRGRAKDSRDGSVVSLKDSPVGRSSESLLDQRLAGSVADTEAVCQKLVAISELLSKVISVEEAKEDSKAKQKHRSDILLSNSIFTEDFFDAHEYIGSIKTSDGVLLVENQLEDFDDVNEGPADLVAAKVPDAASEIATLTSSDDLYPLESLPAHVTRRSDIKESTTTPPSILQTLKKNIGTDMSSISLPVTSNEPLTMLQKFAEFFEYTGLIDQAIAADDDHKYLYIAAFATSYLSSLRDKERSLRKPFMPLLGETFELVRDDLNYRLVLEKVCHRPSIFCLNVSNGAWEINATIMPTNKFWGKTMEIINKGSFKLQLRKTGEVFEWNQPTTILRNLIAGEKYIEPIETLTVDSSKGEKTVVEFKSTGFFSGRAEEIQIKSYNNDVLRPVYAKGTWTEHLWFTDNLNAKKKNGADLWNCNKLVENSSKKWGFTRFAAELNEITAIEKNKLPPTDSRLRPDLRLYEDGQPDQAEIYKLHLEQLQRDRRKVMETNNTEHVPGFFVQDAATSKEDILLNWKFIKGEKGYWNRRKTQDWNGICELEFERPIEN